MQAEPPPELAVPHRLERFYRPMAEVKPQQKKPDAEALVAELQRLMAMAAMVRNLAAEAADIKIVATHQAEMVVSMAAEAAAETKETAVTAEHTEEVVALDLTVRVKPITAAQAEYRQAVRARALRKALTAATARIQ